MSAKPPIAVKAWDRQAVWSAATERAAPAEPMKTTPSTVSAAAHSASGQLKRRR